MGIFLRYLQRAGARDFLWAVATVFCIIPYLAYRSLEYTSDGLFLYSAMRNTLNGHGFLFEGPTVEYFLGTHAHLSLVFLLPLIYVFKSPLVLAYVSAGSHVVGTFLFYSWFSKDRRAVQPVFALLTVLYFFYPSAFAMMGTYYLFLPDLLLEPLILFGFYFVMKERWVASALVGALILGLKEEYIPLFPALAFFFLAAFESRTGVISKVFRFRFAAVTFVMTAFGGLLSFGVMKYYRGLNVFGYGMRGLEVGIGAPLGEVIFSLWTLVEPVLFILLFAFWKKLEGRKQALFWVLVFLCYRFGIDILAYQKFPVYHWCNTVLAPTLFLSCAIYLAPAIANLTAKGQRQLLLTIAMTLLLMVPQVLHTGTTGLIVRSLKNRGPWNRDKAAELAVLREHTVPPQGLEYFIGPEYSFLPFMERSFVSFSILMSEGDVSPLRRQKLIENAKFIILPDASEKPPMAKLPEATALVGASRELVWKTAHYRLYGGRSLK